MGIEALIASVVGAIVALTEILKQVLAKAFPGWELNPKVLQLISGAIVIATVVVGFKPEAEGLTGALIFAFLSSSGLYGWALKPIKDIFTELKGQVSK